MKKTEKKKTVEKKPEKPAAKSKAPRAQAQATPTKQHKKRSAAELCGDMPEAIKGRLAQLTKKVQRRDGGDAVCETVNQLNELLNTLENDIERVDWESSPALRAVGDRVVVSERVAKDLQGAGYSQDIALGTFVVKTMGETHATIVSESDETISTTVKIKGLKDAADAGESDDDDDDEDAA